MHNIILHCSETMELEIFREFEKKKKCKVMIITYWENSELTRIKKIFPNVKTINYKEFTFLVSFDFRLAALFL